MVRSEDARSARGDAKCVPPGHGHLQGVGKRSRAARQQLRGGATSGAPAAQPTRGRGASCDGQSRVDVKLNRFGPPPWATGRRWSICSKWEESQPPEAPAAASADAPGSSPSEYTPDAGFGAGVATRETASPADDWQPSADALPAAPSDAPFSPASEYTPGTVSALKWPPVRPARRRRQHLTVPRAPTAASWQRRWRGRWSATCGSAVGPCSGRGSPRWSGVGQYRDLVPPSSTAAVSPGDAGVSSPPRRAGAAGAAAARVRFGARREDSFPP